MKRAQSRARARGHVLVVSLVLLVGASLVGAALMRVTALQERIAAGTRDKQRALEAAQVAMRYGERWLLQADRGTGASCSGLGEKTVADLQVCSDGLAAQDCAQSLTGSASNPSTWPARFTYTPPRMSVAAGGGLHEDADKKDHDANYAAAPGLYIEYAGSSSAGTVYCVTGYGGGAAAGTLATVRSLFLVRAANEDSNPNHR